MTRQLRRDVAVVHIRGASHVTLHVPEIKKIVSRSWTSHRRFLPSQIFLIDELLVAHLARVRLQLEVELVDVPERTEKSFTSRRLPPTRRVPIPVLLSSELFGAEVAFERCQLEVNAVDVPSQAGHQRELLPAKVARQSTLGVNVLDVIAQLLEMAIADFAQTF